MSEIDSSIQMEIIKRIRRCTESTQLTIVSDMMYEAGVFDEFVKFYGESEDVDFWENLHDFCKLHPDKFHITDECEGYAQYVSLKPEQ